MLEGNQNLNFGRKTKISEGNQKFWKESKKHFGSLEGNQKYWKETKHFGRKKI